MGLLILGWAFSVLGGLLGIFIAYHIHSGKDKNDPTGATYLYDEDSRKRGGLMFATALSMFLLGLAARFLI